MFAEFLLCSDFVGTSHSALKGGSARMRSAAETVNCASRIKTDELHSPVGEGGPERWMRLEC